MAQKEKSEIYRDPRRKLNQRSIYWGKARGGENEGIKDDSDNNERLYQTTHCVEGESKYACRADASLPRPSYAWTNCQHAMSEAVFFFDFFFLIKIKSSERCCQTVNEVDGSAVRSLTVCWTDSGSDGNIFVVIFHIFFSF